LLSVAGAPARNRLLSAAGAGVLALIVLRRGLRGRRSR
jgi:hypothetical protein